jgi:hypothetical protein
MVAISPAAVGRPAEPVYVPKVLTGLTVVSLGVCVLINAALLAVLLRGDGTAADAGTWVSSLNGLSILAMLLTGIVYLRWLWQMRVNAEAFRPDGHRLKRGWTTGAWLLPLASLVLPLIIMSDIWAASRPAGQPRRVSALLITWWLLFLAGQSDAEKIGQVGGMIGAGSAMVAGALAITIVVKLVRMQQTRIDERP